MDKEISGEKLVFRVAKTPGLYNKCLEKVCELILIEGGIGDCTTGARIYEIQSIQSLFPLRSCLGAFVSHYSAKMWLPTE